MPVSLKLRIGFRHGNTQNTLEVFSGSHASLLLGVKVWIKIRGLPVEGKMAELISSARM